MAYRIDFPAAANRHYKAACKLHEAPPPRRLHDAPPPQHSDVAGYLYGIAAECAVKELLRRAVRYQEPAYEHFPALKNTLREQAQGRHAAALQRFAEPGFLNAWDVAMRYAPGHDVPAAHVDRWAQDATSALAAMEDA